MTDELFDLSGRVAIVTGASRGLGQQFARALARAGADLAITSRHAETLDEFREELERLDRRVVALELDVRRQDSIAQAVAAAHQQLGRLDILVNNAGCNVRKPALEVSWDEWNQVVDTNLRGQFFMAQQVARHMVQQEFGRVINIGSVTSVFGYAGMGPYCASRGGIKQLTMSLADDWGRHGITVNCLAPGWFRTAQSQVLYEDETWVESILERTPLGRTGEAGDLDSTVVFLASPASRFVTGQTILVDGGFSTGATRALPD
ncbi:MAG: SDR family NAD(P)-dependent oxidoreductase [Planctomycetota bacterium]|nr:MAG: SDR family NAD(P)-dependent oxidoreductase [Planctomycetota bacterium]REJ91103.1 MAG: SDR family NAD(P)-dependent oxidoreductase [Planctomycetota bacterium]REK27645.1 MAG: SDR family NAD(P)-dependent oxidoreductase [Planctomycetota bacterium]REK38512.1 MAG: SDR family NAD(P)-dependent oxidoreductase [Planctomycetota bacterium]